MSSITADQRKLLDNTSDDPRRRQDLVIGHDFTSITDKICGLAEKMKVEMPIAREVCAVLLDGKAPKQAVVDLMTRPPKAESESFERSGGE